MRTLLLVALLLVVAVPARGDDASLPPGERPFPIHAGIFLLNLSQVDERSETFDADLYLRFRWSDPRLAFAGLEPRRYFEDAALTRLGEIWWPELEFVNTAEPGITNRSLEIAPDGAVELQLGMSSTFRADLDLRRFPFDRQTLTVQIQSFFWNADQMVFVPDTTRTGFKPGSTFEGLLVSRVDAVVGSFPLADWDRDFSELVARIEVERQSSFYVWTVFAPVTLIFLISCAVFRVPVENFHDRLGTSLTALLACVATQFAISFNLPRISYLTVIDRVFVLTYACIAAGVLVSTLQSALLRRDPARAARVDRWAGLGLPALFLTLLVLLVVA